MWLCVCVCVVLYGVVVYLKKIYKIWQKIFPELEFSRCAGILKQKRHKNKRNRTLIFFYFLNLVFLFSFVAYAWMWQQQRRNEWATMPNTQNTPAGGFVAELHHHHPPPRVAMESFSCWVFVFLYFCFISVLFFFFYFFFNYLAWIKELLSPQ